GPTFRAETSNPTRHAAEFLMVEPEIGFAEVGAVMKLTYDMLKYAMKYVLEHAPEEMEFFNSFVDKTVLERMNNVINSDFGRITYAEGIKVRQESGAN
ncbi:amino acid--tRNA ligase-related protein, partial [Bacillus anthracis]|uniref:amino acid--tRNA ligase-related protein n=1 Tax=Bacillus anthracis TaxID=1392 RepID=UPI00284441CF